MNKNAIQMREEIDVLIDRARSPRYEDREYYKAINDAINQIVDDRIDNIKTVRKYSFESVQRLRDELYTLIKEQVLPVNNNRATYPADYLHFVSAELVISGTNVRAFPAEYNTIEKIIRDPFKRPTDEKVYYIENSQGLTFHRGITAGTTCNLAYLKKPNIVTIGDDSDKIVAGTILANGTNYYVYDQAVYTGTTYYPGDIITGSGAALASGTVIVSTNITNCDLPDRMHNEIIRLASAILQGTTEDYNKKRDLEKDLEKS